MIKCPQCGHENVPGTQFCEGCGEDLPAANGAADSAPAPAATGSAMVQCPACDNMNPAENVACEVCGAELPHPAGATPMPAPTPLSIPAPLAAPDADAFASSPAPAMPDVDVSMPSAPLSTAAPGATPVPLDAPLDVPDAPPIPPAPPAPLIAPAPGAELQPGQVKLVVEQGQTVGAQFVLGDAEMLVGREDADDGIYPDIDLADQDAGYVHRRHATLKFENGVLSVTHLGGGNKTRINNRPIPDDEPQPVKLGDKVAFGKVVLRVLPA